MNLAELYERLGALCRQQVACAATEDLDRLEHLLSEREALLQQIARLQSSGRAPLPPAEWERAMNAARAAATLAAEAEAVLARKLAAVRDRLTHAGGGRAALRCYRAASLAAATVDRYS